MILEPELLFHRSHDIYVRYSYDIMEMVFGPKLLFHRGQIILELKSSEAVSEDDPSNLDYRWRSTYKSFCL